MKSDKEEENKNVKDRGIFSNLLAKFIKIDKKNNAEDFILHYFYFFLFFLLILFYFLLIYINHIPLTL